MILILSELLSFSPTYLVYFFDLLPMSAEVAEKTLPEGVVAKIDGVEKTEGTSEDATMDENETEKMQRAARQSAYETYACSPTPFNNFTLCYS